MPFVVWTYILALVLLFLQLMALLMLGALLLWVSRMRAAGPGQYNQHGGLRRFPPAPASLAMANFAV